MVGRVGFSNPVQDLCGKIDPVFEKKSRLVTLMAFFSKAIGNDEIQATCKGPNMAKGLCELDRLWESIALDSLVIR